MKTAGWVWKLKSGEVCQIHTYPRPLDYYPTVEMCICNLEL